MGEINGSEEEVELKDRDSDSIFDTLTSGTLQILWEPELRSGKKSQIQDSINPLPP
jgi:hypothetical protein